MALDPERLAEHDALAGVPPPAEATTVLGHDGALAALGEALAAGRLHHAWLLQGPKGIGKATLAFRFARRLLGTEDPERGLSVDRQIATGAHPNLLHLSRPLSERGGFKTQITVDEVRRLNRFLHTTAGSGGWRVAIVDPVDDLNRNAANALLKSLEEPPPRAVFFLVNHLPGRLLPTVRSRCRVLRCDPLSALTVADILQALGVPGGERDHAAAAASADGSVRAAILRLTSGSLDVERDVDALLGGGTDWSGVLALAERLAGRGAETAFDLAVETLLDRLAMAARARAEVGQLEEAQALARLWAAETARFREGLLFNLDRKQLVLTHFSRRFALKALAPAH